MRKHKRPTNIMAFGVILITIIFATLLIEYGFSGMGENRYQRNNDGTHTIDLSYFKITTPIEYKYHSLQGIDSYVGLITDGHDSITFDYGWYSNDLTQEDFELSNVEINGRKAFLGYSPSYGNAVHFPGLKNDNSLTLHSANINIDEGFKIYKSIEINK